MLASSRTVVRSIADEEEISMPKRYSPKLKFQVVLEVLSGEKSVAQVAKAYGVHPNSVNKWKRDFLHKGPEVFSQDSAIAEYEQRIAQLERLLGKKEVEIALLKNFLGQTR
jgi:transposase-like protein